MLIYAVNVIMYGRSNPNNKKKWKIFIYVNYLYINMSDSEYSDNDDSLSDEEIVPVKPMHKSFIKMLDKPLYEEQEPQEELDDMQIEDDLSSDNDSYFSDIYDDDYEDNTKKTAGAKPKQGAQENEELYNVDTDDEEEEGPVDDNLKKFNQEIIQSYIDEYHPECLYHNEDEVQKLTNVVRNKDNIIIDPFHTSVPFLTKFEKARILGQRATQIENGAKPFIQVPENILEANIIAEMELEQKKIPFIIKRPIPGGAFEYWKITDLEYIH